MDEINCMAGEGDCQRKVEGRGKVDGEDQFSGRVEARIRCHESVIKIGVHF